MSDARQLYIHVPAHATATGFQLQYSTTGATWTDYNTADDTPSQPSTQLIADLDANRDYLLDGLNSPAGTMAAASQSGNTYRLRLLVDATAGNWSDAFRINTYPSGADVAAWITASGLTVSSAVQAQLGLAASAARRDLERVTRRFLAGPVETRYFDPPSGRDNLLFLPDLAQLTSIAYYPTGGTSTALVANTDYWLEPVNGPALSDPEPYTRLRLRQRWSQPLASANRQSIQITGRWGYATNVPDDVFLAIQASAALSLWGQAQLGATGGIQSWTDGDRTVNYGADRWKGVSEGWGAIRDAVIARYRIWTL